MFIFLCFRVKFQPIMHVFFIDYLSFLFYCAYDTKNSGFFDSRLLKYIV